jgi:hypothetical protein
MANTNENYLSQEDRLFIQKFISKGNNISRAQISLLFPEESRDPEFNNKLENLIKFKWIQQSGNPFLRLNVSKKYNDLLEQMKAYDKVNEDKKKKEIALEWLRKFIAKTRYVYPDDPRFNNRSNLLIPQILTKEFKNIDVLQAVEIMKDPSLKLEMHTEIVNRKGNDKKHIYFYLPKPDNRETEDLDSDTNEKKQEIVHGDFNEGNSDDEGNENQENHEKHETEDNSNESQISKDSQRLQTSEDFHNIEVSSLVPPPSIALTSNPPGMGQMDLINSNNTPNYNNFCNNIQNSIQNSIKPLKKEENISQLSDTELALRVLINNDNSMCSDCVIKIARILYMIQDNRKYLEEHPELLRSKDIFN